jgi:hypothetical protein
MGKGREEGALSWTPQQPSQARCQRRGERRGERKREPRRRRGAARRAVGEVAVVALVARARAPTALHLPLEENKRVRLVRGEGHSVSD